MKPVYYEIKPVIDVAIVYKIKDDGLEFEVRVPVVARIIGQSDGGDVIQTTVYNAVKGKLGHDQFFLVPSAKEIELQSYLADQMAHPEKYPNGESVGFGWGLGSRDDT